MDTVARVEELAAERGISMNRLSEICDVPYSTIINTKKRGGQLQVATIERICIGLEIKLSVFFAKDDPPLLLFSDNASAVELPLFYLIPGRFSIHPAPCPET